MIENINVFHLFHLSEITDPLQTLVNAGSDLYVHQVTASVFLSAVDKEKLRH